MAPSPKPTAFMRRVLHTLRRIPAGRVATYGDIAAACGRPRAARAVGNICRAAPERGLPYHRIVAAGGRLGGFGRSPQMKAALLVAEGHTIRSGRIVGFAKTRWAPGRKAQSPEERGEATRSGR